MTTRMLAVGGAMALSLATSSAQAATCSGAPPFTDVSASATYCTNTEWLANRGVTLGCVGTNFCPNDPVTRASMALFMNRLADALVLRPVRVQQYLGAFTLTTGAVDNAVCQQDVLAAANYHRSISMTTHVSAQSAGGVVHDGHSANLLDRWRSDLDISEFIWVIRRLRCLLYGPRDFACYVHAGCRRSPPRRGRGFFCRRRNGCRRGGDLLHPGPRPKPFGNNVAVRCR